MPCRWSCRRPRKGSNFCIPAPPFKKLKPRPLAAEELLRPPVRPRMQIAIDARVEFEKWTNFDTTLIFTNCGALTWYLRKAWLLDNAPELMPVSQPGESFEIRRT